MALARVVVVGSGFGGLNAARALAGKPVEVTVVDRDNYHGFWPLLYQVATAGLGSDDIAHPIRALFDSAANVDVRLATVTGIDLAARRVVTATGPDIGYDYLLLAAGSIGNDFGVPGVAEHAFTLKTLPDAVRLRNHVLASFEAADAEPAGAEGALTIVIVGGGSTGVEMAGALSELVSRNLAADFRHLDLRRARIVLVEMTDHLLPGYAPRLQRVASATLEHKGVELRLQTRLAQVSATGVTFGSGEVIRADTVVWTAGIRANPLAGCLPGEKGKGGAVAVAADLSLPGYPEVFVVGDLASVPGPDGEPLPQVAQVAIQGARHVARSICRRLEGKPTRPFRYRDHGTMATIGRRAAVAQLPGGITLSGTVGWFAWLAVHLTFLIGFRNRAVVLVNWGWNYLTWDRGSRVILDTSPPGSAAQRPTA